MDQFYEFWEFISDGNDDIGREIVKYKRLSDECVEEDESNVLGKRELIYLKKKLEENPYITFEIIKILLSQKNPQSNRTLEEICFQALNSLINQELTDTKNLYTLLSVLELSQNFQDKISIELLPKIVKLKRDERIGSDVYLSLISRSSLEDNLLKEFLNCERDQIIGYDFNLKSLFLDTVYNKMHWIYSVLANIDKLKTVFNETLYQQLNIFKMITFCQNMNVLKVNEWLDKVENINFITFDCDKLDSENQKFCFLEIQRRKRFLNILKRYCTVCDVQNIDYFKGFNILLSLLKFVEMEPENYDEIMENLNRNHSIAKQQLRICCGEDSSLDQETEINIFNEYIIVKTYFTIIIRESNEDISDEDKLTKNAGDIKFIHDVFQKIQSLEKIIRIIELVFTFLFLHSEQLNPDSYEIFLLQIHPRFICDKNVVEIILRSLKNELEQLLKNNLYQNCDDTIKYRLKTITNYIDNAILRFSIVSDFQKDEGVHQSLCSSDITFNRHASSVTENTTTTETTSTKKTSSESSRKSQSKSLKSSPEYVSTDKFINTDTNQNAASESEVSADDFPGLSSKNIISKMLMSPQSLVNVCLAKGDLEKAHHVLEVYDLKSSDLHEEVVCIEKIQKAKSALNKIIGNENSMTSSTTESESIQVIRTELQIASYSTRFMDALETFSESIDIPQSAKDLKFIRTHQDVWPYYRQYDSSIIDVLPMVDLLISLPCRPNLREAIYNKILGKLDMDFESDCQIGYMKFLKNIMECLTIYKNIFGEDITIPELLQTEIYSFDPEVYEKKLTNLRNAAELMTFTIEDMKYDVKVAKFVRFTDSFEKDVDYVKRVLNFEKNFQKMIQKYSKSNLNSANIYEVNIDEVFCELAYEQNIGPDKLDVFAYNMNINLSQVLASGAVEPIIIDSNVNDSQLLEYFLLNNRHCGFSNKKFEAMLKPPKDSRSKSFKIAENQKSVLNYVKRDSFLISFLLKDIHNADYQSVFYDLNLLENMKKMRPIKNLATLFSGNLTLTCLNYDHVDVRKLLNYFRSSKTYEDNLKILQSINPRQYKKHKAVFDQLKDFYIEQLLNAENYKGNSEKFYFIEKISNINLKSGLLLKYLTHIPCIDYVQNQIEGIINSPRVENLNSNYKSGLEIWSRKLKLYKKVSEDLMIEGDFLPWLEIMELNEKTPEFIMDQLLNKKKLTKLYIDWIDMYPLVNTPSKLKEFRRIFIKVLNNIDEDQLDDVYAIIESLPAQTIIDMYFSILPELRNLQTVVYVVDYLEKNDRTEKSKVTLQKYQLSIKIYEELNKLDEQLWTLAKYPLLILEQLLMNLKIEIASIVIKKMEPLLMGDPDNQKCNTCTTICHQTFDNLNLHKNTSDCIVYNVNSSHDDVMIRADCIDLLLRVYASKALDFKIVDGNQSMYSSTADVQSMDSLAGIFQMPKEIPKKAQWVPDSEASVCMVCKRSKFTLLNRRHHCRRCGRVVCSSCSQNKKKIPERYADLMVRVCSDCFKQMGLSEIKQHEVEKSPRHSTRSVNSLNSMEWCLSGVIKHDNLVREDFSYEYSPNVGLCVAICDLHSANENLAQFLIFHCQRLELLLRPIQSGKPNSEIDYLLVAQMLYCLSLTARKYESLTHNSIMEHAEIILTIVKNGCENLLPSGPLNSMSLRKLTDTLVRIEKFELAIDLSLKCGFAKSGVLAAWGISCLKAGMFDTAREKFAYCLSKIKEDAFKNCGNLIDMIDWYWNNKNVKAVTRPNKSPPLVVEIKRILENLANIYKQEIFQENIKRHSIPNLTEVRSICKQKDMILSEPAVNIKNTLANLKNIADGCHDEINSNSSRSGSVSRDKNKMQYDEDQQGILKNRYFQELIFYLVTYGGHIEIIQFLVENNFLKEALKYMLINKLEKDIFIKYIYMHALKRGNAKAVIDNMRELDKSLKVWESYIKDICGYLEQKNLLNSLYHLQIILNDPIRASMTCVRFYSQHCTTFSELHNNSFHLINAQKHLQTQLEASDWSFSIRDRKRRSTSSSLDETSSFILKLDVKTINGHINTICRQIEVAKFLANAEKNGRDVMGILKKIWIGKNPMRRLNVPTLFGNHQECLMLAVLVLISGENVSEGFGLSYRIIQDCNLKSMKVYEITANFLGLNGRVEEVARLIENIKSNDVEGVKEIVDHVICLAVNSANIFYGTQGSTKNKQFIENLINGISDSSRRLDVFFNTGHLKAAYLLAVRLNQEEMLRKIYTQAQKDNNDYVVKLCERKFMKSGDSFSNKSDYSSKS